jgi:phosphohistidine swiveling domain-containing protein
MSNRVRHFMVEEVEAVLPLLHETYHALGRFQENRSDERWVVLESYLQKAGVALQIFKPLLQSSKQAYFDAILKNDLDISDRIVALDTAVGSLHIEFSVPRAYAHRESETLKEALWQIRVHDADRLPPPQSEALCTGIAASPGVASGKAFLIRKASDYKHVPKGAVVVAEMTRPELVYALRNVSAIVTDIGGLLCHAAIVAREKRIPCVVATKKATQVIRERMLVKVDGSKGTVTLATSKILNHL